MTYKPWIAFAALAVAAAVGGGVRAASHSDAPLIKQDPQANITDVYCFIGTRYNNPRLKVLNVIVHVRPFCEPGDGVIYDRFADDARYSIHLANPTLGATICRYDFEFSDVNPRRPPGLKNDDTILSYGRGTEVGPIQNVGDARHNYVQTYLVRKTVRDRDGTVLGRNLLTPPPNVGRRTTPFYNDANGRAVSGAATFDALDRYTRQTVYSLDSGEATFCGHREDGFFADTPGIFDLLDPRILGRDGRGQTGNGVDGFKGYNVLAYAIQIPVDALRTIPGFPVVGVYASVSRRSVTLRANGERLSLGGWVQVNRMGNPLFNEVLVALGDKDRYNHAAPTEDMARFRRYAQAPEVIFLINTVFGTNFQTANRTDLVGIYIPDVLRVNTSTEAVRLSGQSGFSRLSFLGGDTTMNGTPSGWPNGRRLGDDVIDIAFSAIANGPAFRPPLMPLGDNVNTNDQAYNLVFPYSGTPHAGPTNRKDPS